MSARTLPLLPGAADMECLTGPALDELVHEANAILDGLRGETFEVTPAGHVPMPIRFAAMNTLKAVDREGDRRRAIMAPIYEARRKAYEASITPEQRAELDKGIREAYYTGQPGHYTGD